MAAVNIIYHHFPHYRAPVMRELVKNGRHEYRFFGSLDDVAGIKTFKGDELVKITPLRFKYRGSIWVLKDYWQAIFDRSADAIIMHAPPNMPAAWMAMIVARLIGKKTLFWVHGWLKPEPPIRRFIRNRFFGLADKTLVYGERAKRLAEKAGFNTERLTTIYNSLDYQKAQQAIEDVEQGRNNSKKRPQEFFDDEKLPLIICTARLTRLCRFDLLFQAAAQSKSAGQAINILLVGDGAEREALQELAKQLEINVHFMGACYDEDILANLIYHSDLTVSPGKIGLTVIHSLTYGTPAITHGNLDAQMPEVEAIVPGTSGLLFEHGSSEDLADKIIEWLRRTRPREEIRRDCQKIIAEKWNPTRQRQIIDDAVSQTLT